MRQRLDLNIKQVQKMILTPELRQSIELLAINSIDLNTLVNEISMANPLLNVSQAEPSSINEKEELRKEKQALLEKIERSDYSGYTNTGYQASDKETSFLNYYHTDGDLVDDLSFQFNCSVSCQEERHIADLIFHNLDSKGYLKVDLADIADQSGACIDKVREVKEKINKLEPKGIGATSLEECLLIQCKGDETCKDIIRYNLEDIANNRIEKIAKERNISIEETVQRLDNIRKLNPKPGASYTDNRPVSYIYPEAYIYKEYGTYKLYMDKDLSPRLSINPYYKNMVREADGETLKYLKKQIESAQWLIDSISQRESTIKTILENLIVIQKDFLDHGKKRLKPLSQKDLADKTGLSQSTISRVVNDKYVSTPRGIIEIAEFFSTNSGGEDNLLSADGIQVYIRELIDKEDKSKPLSDSKIETKLKDMGIKISRRTVAKYRDQMDIPKASLRKEY